MLCALLLSARPSFLRGYEHIHIHLHPRTLFFGTGCAHAHFWKRLGPPHRSLRSSAARLAPEVRLLPLSKNLLLNLALLGGRTANWPHLAIQFTAIVRYLPWIRPYPPIAPALRPFFFRPASWSPLVSFRSTFSPMYFPRYVS